MLVFYYMVSVKTSNLCGIALGFFQTGIDTAFFQSCQFLRRCFSGVVFLFREDELQQDRGDDRGEYHHDDQRCHELLAHQPYRSTLVGNDQGDLTTGDHTNTDLQALLVGVSHDLCTQTAADHLGDNCQQHQQQHEYDQLSGQTVQCHCQTDVCEEDRGQEHVGQRVETVDHILVLFQTGYCQTGNECTGDVGNAEADLGNKGQQQAENKCHDVVTAEVFVAGFPPLLKEEVVQYSGTDRHNEERQNVDDNSEYTVVDQQCAQCLFAAAVAGLLAAQTDNDSQSDNAQNVIDYGSTQNGIAGTGVCYKVE